MNNDKSSESKTRGTAPRAPRVRRTPEEAREQMLAAARQRLLDHGLDGLKVADVAKDVNMSHATLLHHFGSSEGMRRALVERMTHELLSEFIAALDGARHDAAVHSKLLQRLFEVLADDRHAQLFAWRALSLLREPQDPTKRNNSSQAMVGVLLERLAQQDGAARSGTDARQAVTLAVSAAIGMGVARGWLTQVGLMQDKSDVRQFADWLSALLDRRINAQANAVEPEPLASLERPAAK